MDAGDVSRRAREVRRHDLTVGDDRFDRLACDSLEIHAEVVAKATRVDGVYDKDPLKHSDAVRFPKIGYSEVLSRKPRRVDRGGAATYRFGECWYWSSGRRAMQVTSFRPASRPMPEHLTRRLMLKSTGLAIASLLVAPILPAQAAGSTPADERAHTSELATVEDEAIAWMAVTFEIAVAVNR